MTATQKQQRRQLGYAKHYRYPFYEPQAYVANEQYFPDNMPVKGYYQPSERSLEKRFSKN